MKLRIAQAEMDDEIDITPLIDCIFLLVLFFMVTSSFIEEPENDPRPYTITMPKVLAAGSGGRKEDETVTLTVNGTYLLQEGEEENEIDDLETVLKKLQEDPSRKEGPIRIRCVAEVQSATTTKSEEARGFEIVLPTAASPSTIRRDEADRLSVSLKGELAFRDQAGEHEVTDLEKLLSLLQKRNTEAKKRPVILRCDARCTVQQLMQVKNVLKQAGVGMIFEEVEIRHGK